MGAPVAAGPPIGWDSLTSNQKALAGVIAIGSVGAAATFGALVGSLAGVGAAGGIVWNISVILVGGLTKKMSDELHPTIASIAGIAGTIFGGAFALMAFKEIGYSAAVGLSVKMTIVAAGIVIGAMAATGLLVLTVSAVANTCMAKKKFEENVKSHSAAS